MALEPRLFNAVVAKLTAEGLVKESENTLALPRHQITFSADQLTGVSKLMQDFAARPYAPPTLKEAHAAVGKDVIDAMLAKGELVAVSDEVAFRKVDYDLMVARIRNALESRDTITLAEVRDLFDTSRKYAQALLEHLDRIGVTVRDGDLRRLKRASPTLDT